MNGIERWCLLALISTPPVSSTRAAIQRSLVGIGVPADFNKGDKSG